MKREEMKYNTILSPFKWFILENFPYIEEDFDALTNWQLFCKLGKEMNKIIEKVNLTGEQVEILTNAFNDLKNYVDTYFDNLDVQEEVNVKLDKMVEDGTLSRIINQEIFSELNEKVNNKLDKDFPKSNDIDFERLGRIVDLTHLLTSETNGYYGMQGGCLVDENTYVFVTNHHNTIDTYEDDISLLRKIDLRTGAVLLQKTIEIGHANGIIYDSIEHKYYVTPTHSNVSASGFENKVITLDENFNIIQTNNTLLNFDSLSIDNEGNLYGGITYKLDTINGQKIYKLNKSDFSVTDTITLDFPIPYTLGTGQDFEIFNNRIYFLQYQPSAIFVFDMSGNYELSYRLENKNFYNWGEVQNINSLGNGKFLIGSTWQPTGRLHTLEQFYIIDTLHNQPIINERLNNYKEDRYNLKEIHINNSVTTFNPDGTSEKPFYCIDEVIANDIKNPITLFLDSETNYAVARVNSFNGSIYTSHNASLISGVGYNEILFRNSKAYLNSIKEVPSLNLEINSDIKTYNCKLVGGNTNYLVYVNQHSVYEAENTYIGITSDLTNALFVNNHGRIIWNKGNNTPLTSALSNITKWFIGKIDILDPIPLFSGTMTKNDTKLINNGVIDCFKQLELRFNDLGDTYIPARNQEYERTLVNFSTSGQGNNNFRQLVVKLNNGTLSITKANQVGFNAQGQIAIDTNPTANILNIYAL